MLKTRSTLLESMIKEENVHQKVFGERNPDELIAKRISLIIQGNQNIVKSSSTHALRMENVKTKVKYSKKHEGQNSYLSPTVASVQVNLLGQTRLFSKRASPPLL